MISVLWKMRNFCPYSDRITEVVVYRWNRSYPGDFHLDLDLNQWRLVQTTEFAGYSHEKITKEIYRK